MNIGRVQGKATTELGFVVVLLPMLVGIMNVPCMLNVTFVPVASVVRARVRAPQDLRCTLLARWLRWSTHGPMVHPPLHCCVRVTLEKLFLALCLNCYHQTRSRLWVLALAYQSCLVLWSLSTIDDDEAGTGPTTFRFHDFRVVSLLVVIFGCL